MVVDVFCQTLSDIFSAGSLLQPCIYEFVFVKNQINIRAQSEPDPRAQEQSLYHTFALHFQISSHLLISIHWN